MANYATNNNYDRSSIKHLLEEIIRKNKSYYRYGKAASYIPALKNKNLEDVGVAVTNIYGNSYCAGEYMKKFTIQSISKVISLILALIDNGEDYVFDRVGTESFDKPFNTIEISGSKPINPMINSGAIAVVSMIKGKDLDEKITRILSFTRRLAGNKNININKDIYMCERSTGNRNKSIIYYLKDMNMIEGDISEILDLYFMQCSIEVTAIDLANIASTIANNGINPKTKEVIISQDIAKIVRTIMAICGMYNESGKFLMKVGIPAKSGVGGGIMSVVPNKIGIGIYGPALNDKGNSIVGIRILEDLSIALKLHMFS